MKHKRILMAMILVCFMASIAGAQNNHPSLCPIYYNLQDTSMAEESVSIKLPLLIPKESNLIDSVEKYIAEACHNKYGQYEDSNGVYFNVVFSTRAEDSNGLYIYISTTPNYYMYMSLVCNLNNDFTPNGYRQYLAGCFLYEGYLVIVKSKQYIPEEETQRFFTITDDSVTLQINQEVPLRALGKNLEPSILYSVPFLSRSNYMSPVYKRKSLDCLR